MNASQESMTVNNAQDARSAIVAFKAVNFADALGDTSVRTRRWLLLFSVLGIILAAYSVNLKQIPWLDIPSPDNPGDLFPTIILVAVVYHLIAFALYATADVVKWHVTADSSVFSFRSQMVFRLDEHVRQLADQLAKMPNMAQSPEMALRESLDGARAVADDSIRHYRSFYVQSRVAYRIKVIAVWCWELALPICLGLLASWRLCSSMLHL
jgi:hypothetical protein